MMDKKAKQKWVKALRSRRYKQGLYRLDARGMFCCLGVLCRTQRVKRVDLAGYSRYVFATGEEYDSTVPAGFCGLQDVAIGHLMVMNDTHNMSFAEIADYIEKEL